MLYFQNSYSITTQQLDPTDLQLLKASLNKPRISPTHGRVICMSLITLMKKKVCNMPEKGNDHYSYTAQEVRVPNHV
jgi:hypothetical protein